ncbi:MAG: hypothetical protein QNK37_38265 [Acidobacteriota bacterium]|nr:hypothetical protein [Acidobacteriota bacterium]
MMCEKEQAFFGYVIERGGFFNLQTIQLFQKTSRRTSYRRIAKYLKLGYAAKTESYAGTMMGRTTPFLRVQKKVFSMLPEYARTKLPDPQRFNKHEAAKNVQLAHVFLENPDWTLIDPKQKRNILMERLKLTDTQFKQVETRTRKIQEDVVRGPSGQLYVVYSLKPESHISLRHDFEARFLKRWRPILEKGLYVLTISFCDFDRDYYRSHRYYHNPILSMSDYEIFKMKLRSSEDKARIFLESWHCPTVFEQVFFGNRTDA